MRAADAAHLSPGTVLAGCRIERLLGRGGMGEVYLAQHLRLEVPVALKILPSADVGDPGAVARFEREAKLAAKVRHVNVVKIQDVGSEKGFHYILMEYVEGNNLAELVAQQHAPIPWKQALRLAQLAARGTAAVHKWGLIHRDIKPANIMLSADKQVLLMDFGLAREVEGAPDVTRPGSVVGTPAFMSPEQSLGKRLAPASDVFSLGGTLYFLLTAKLPYEGTQMEVLTQVSSGKRPRAVHEVNPYVPQAVSIFVARAMSPRPEQRFPDAAAFAQEIGKLLKLPPERKGTDNTCDTDDGSSVATGGSRIGSATGPELELVPLESIENGSIWQRNKHLLPWIGTAIVLGAVLFLLIRPGHKPTTGGATTGPVVTTEPPKENPKTAPGPAALDVHAGMVQIPAGNVQIGNAEDTLRRHALTLAKIKDHQNLVDDFVRAATKDLRIAYVPAFWIDEYEVTNADYARFVNATRRKAPDHWNGNDCPADLQKHPVTHVSHEDALAYAAWAGKKLPTESQWVRAFRGNKEWMYPWGDRWEPARANVHENNALNGIQTTEVTATPDDVSPFGVHNLLGNVAELMRDRVEMQGEKWVATHGASWDADGCVYGVAAVRCHYLAHVVTRANVGFRCVSEAP